MGKVDITEAIIQVASVPKKLWKIERMMKDAGGYKAKHNEERLRMNIKKEYITKTKEYLRDLSIKLSKIHMLEQEIKMLKDRECDYSSIRFDNIGFNSNNSYKGIDDLIVTNDTKARMKEIEIDRINHEYNIYKLYCSELDDVQKNILLLRYFKKNKNRNRNSFSDIAKKVGYSEMSVKRKHDIVIEHLAYYKYGEKAKY